MAEALLETYEIQNLAEAVSDLKSAAAGYTLEIHVRVTLGGTPPEKVVEKVNEVLEDVTTDLELGE